MSGQVKGGRTVKRWLSMLLALCMVWIMIVPALAEAVPDAGLEAEAVEMVEEKTEALDSESVTDTEEAVKEEMAEAISMENILMGEIAEAKIIGEYAILESETSTIKITTSGQVVDTFNGVEAKYIPGTGNSDTGTYSCAGYVHAYYSAIYGIKVSNLFTGAVPNASEGTFSVTSKPEVGDIGYQLNSSNSGHWFIIKEVNSDNTYTIIEQNRKWISNGNTVTQINRHVSYSDTKGFKVFRWSNKPDTPTPTPDVRYRYNISSQQVKQNADQGGLPSNAPNPVKQGDAYYFNLQVLGGLRVKQVELWVKPNGADSFSQILKETSSSGYSYLYTDDKYTFNIPGEFLYAWRLFYTNGNDEWTPDTKIDVQANEPEKHYLDLNGYLDGENQSGIGGYGTADVWIDGKLSSENTGVSDYYAALPVGTKYEIKNIKAKDGYTYHGTKENSSDSLSGTIGERNLDVRLNFRKNVDIGTGFYAYIKNTALDRYLTNDEDANVTSRSATGAVNQIWYFDRTNA